MVDERALAFKPPKTIAGFDIGPEYHRVYELIHEQGLAADLSKTPLEALCLPVAISEIHKRITSELNITRKTTFKFCYDLLFLFAKQLPVPEAELSEDAPPCAYNLPPTPPDLFKQQLNLIADLIDTNNVPIPIEKYGVFFTRDLTHPLMAGNPLDFSEAERKKYLPLDYQNSGFLTFAHEKKTSSKKVAFLSVDWSIEKLKVRFYGTTAPWMRDKMLMNLDILKKRCYKPGTTIINPGSKQRFEEITFVEENLSDIVLDDEPLKDIIEFNLAVS